MQVCGRPSQLSFCTEIFVVLMVRFLEAFPHVADHSSHGFHSHLTVGQLHFTSLDSLCGRCVHFWGSPLQLSFCTVIFVVLMVRFLEAFPHVADHSSHGFHSHLTVGQLHFTSLDSLCGRCVHFWGSPLQLGWFTTISVSWIPLFRSANPQVFDQLLQGPHLQLTARQGQFVVRRSVSGFWGQDCGRPSHLFLCTVICVVLIVLLREASPHVADHSSHGFHSHLTVGQLHFTSLDSLCGPCVHFWGSPLQLGWFTTISVSWIPLFRSANPQVFDQLLQGPHLQLTARQGQFVVRRSVSGFWGQDCGRPSQLTLWTVIRVVLPKMCCEKT